MNSVDIKQTHQVDGLPGDDDDIMSMAFSLHNSQGDLNFDGSKKDTFELGVAKKEGEWVWWLRFMTGAVLVSVAIVVCLVVFLTGRGGENEQFDQEFSNLAEKLVQSFEKAVKQRFDCPRELWRRFDG